jgi:hypothetical protein
LYDYITSGLREWVKDVLCATSASSIIITGNAQGGAQANLLAVEMIVDNSRIHAEYTTSDEKNDKESDKKETGSAKKYETVEDKRRGSAGHHDDDHNEQKENDDGVHDFTSSKSGGPGGKKYLSPKRSMSKGKSIMNLLGLGNQDREEAEAAARAKHERNKMKFYLIPDIDLITFGAPKVFDKITANKLEKLSFHKRVRRYVTAGDIMPTLPHHKHGFQHIGDPIFQRLNNNGWYKYPGKPSAEYDRLYYIQQNNLQGGAIVPHQNKAATDSTKLHNNVNNNLNNLYSGVMPTFSIGPNMIKRYRDGLAIHSPLKENDSDSDKDDEDEEDFDVHNTGRNTRRSQSNEMDTDRDTNRSGYGRSRGSDR